MKNLPVLALARSQWAENHYEMLRGLNQVMHTIILSRMLIHNRRKQMVEAEQEAETGAVGVECELGVEFFRAPESVRTRKGIKMSLSGSNKRSFAAFFTVLARNLSSNN